MPTEMYDPWPIYSGDPESMEMTFQNNDGTPQDLTEFYAGYRVQWRKDPYSNSFMTIAVDDSRADEGVLRLELTKEQTRDMSGPGYFDIEGDMSGDPRTILRGRTSWKQDVTR